MFDGLEPMLDGLEPMLDGLELEVGLFADLPQDQHGDVVCLHGFGRL